MPGLCDNSAVLLMVISYLDLPSILHLHQTCKSIHELVSRYKFSIAQAAGIGIWRSGMASEPAYLLISSINDMLRLHVSRQLAIKLVASRHSLIFYQEYYCAPIAPDDPMGDEMRDYLTKGFMLTFELHRIYESLEPVVQPPKQASKIGIFKRLRSIRKGESTPPPQPDLRDLQRKWSQYTNALTHEDFKALGLLTCAMMGHSMYDGCLKESRGEPPPWTYVKSQGEYGAIEWMVAFVLFQGPGFVKRLWSDDSAVSDAASQMLEMACKQHSAELILLEQPIISRVLGTLSKRGSSWEFSDYYVSLYFFRRGPLSPDTPQEEQLRLRSVDQAHFLNLLAGPGCGTGRKPYTWMKAKHRDWSRREPVVYFAQGSLDID